MVKLRLRILPVLLVISLGSSAAIVDTVKTYSAAMKKEIKAVVIRPDNHAKLKELAVVYLLHGHGGDYSSWLTLAKGFERSVDQYNFMVVCPDAGNSWYWDSPTDSSSRYETYITNELVPWVDKNYRTIKNRKGRAITGLSMGGHGALYLAFRHQDIFGAAGSMSGGVDIRPFPLNWNMSQRLGTYAENPDVWEKNTVINMLHLLTPKSLSLIIDCGTDDFFFLVNKNLHDKLIERNIPHDFIVRPGSHDWQYWLNAVQYQFLFMHNYFLKAKTGT
jgi:S-formylglutathione hydrolase FrmB